MLNSAEHEINLLINIEVAIINGTFMLPYVTCWHFNIKEHDKVHAQLNMKCMKRVL